MIASLEPTFLPQLLICHLTDQGTTKQEGQEGIKAEKCGPKGLHDGPSKE